MTPRLSTLIIRADANTTMGSGHVMRCLALAAAWREAGGSVVFVSCCESTGLRERICVAGFALEELASSCPDPADWMTMQGVIARHAPDWIVLDGYHFTPKYAEGLRSSGCCLLVIDDMADWLCYPADLLLNQNLNATPALYADKQMYQHRPACSHRPNPEHPIPNTQYRTPNTEYPTPDVHLWTNTGRPLVDKHPEFLLGIEYALLRPEFGKWRTWKRDVPQTARRVLVTFGGSDPDNTTLHALEALEQTGISGLEVRVVVGAANPHGEILRQFVTNNMMNVRLLTDVKDMPAQMAWADVAVSAGGSTCWELAFMGLPSVLVAIADNQAASMQAMHEQELAICAPRPIPDDMTPLRDSVRALIKNRAQRQALSERGRARIDGRGAERVIAAMRQRAKEFTP